MASMKFYYDGQLIRTSENHNYVQALLSKNDDGTYGCFSCTSKAGTLGSQLNHWKTIYPDSEIFIADLTQDKPEKKVVKEAKEAKAPEIRKPVAADQTATIRPVIEQLESLFSIFNKHFYQDELEKPIITVSPDEGRNAYGWCTTYKAWKKADQKDDEGYYEINICSEYLTRSFGELAATLLHEMVHLYNMQNGIKDTSRNGSYHNLKFKEIAEQHGLIIDKSEKYGWTLTSLQESTKQFLNELNNTEQGFSIYRDSAAKMKQKSSTKQSSRKYICPTCGMIIRATKEVRVMCMDCEEEMELSE